MDDDEGMFKITDDDVLIPDDKEPILHLTKLFEPLEDQSVGRLAKYYNDNKDHPQISFLEGDLEPESDEEDVFLKKRVYVPIKEEKEKKRKKKKKESKNSISLINKFKQSDDDEDEDDETSSSSDDEDYFYRNSSNDSGDENIDDDVDLGMLNFQFNPKKISIPPPPPLPPPLLLESKNASANTPTGLLNAHHQAERNKVLGRDFPELQVPDHIKEHSKDFLWSTISNPSEIVKKKKKEENPVDRSKSSRRRRKKKTMYEYNSEDDEVSADSEDELIKDKIQKDREERVFRYRRMLYEKGRHNQKRQRALQQQRLKAAGKTNPPPPPPPPRPSSGSSSASSSASSATSQKRKSFSSRVFGPSPPSLGGRNNQPSLFTSPSPGTPGSLGILNKKKRLYRTQRVKEKERDRARERAAMEESMKERVLKAEVSVSRIGGPSRNRSGQGGRPGIVRVDNGLSIFRPVRNPDLIDPNVPWNNQNFKISRKKFFKNFVYLDPNLRLGEIKEEELMEDELERNSKLNMYDEEEEEEVEDDEFDKHMRMLKILSKDKYTTDSQIMSSQQQLGKESVIHSQPALRLDKDYFPDIYANINNRDFSNVEKKTFIFPPRQKFPIHIVRPRKSKRRLHGSTKRVKKKSRLTADDHRVILMEFVEARPPLYNRCGMGTRIYNYYQRSNDLRTKRRMMDRIPDDGISVQMNNPEELNMFGHLREDSFMTTTQNRLYSSQIFPNRPPNTDFLATLKLNPITNRRERIHIREIPLYYTVGHVQKEEFPVPYPTGMSNEEYREFVLKKYVMKEILKLRKQGVENASVRMSQIKRHNDQSDSKITKSLSEEFKSSGERGDRAWSLKNNSTINEEIVNKMLEPERVCARESMILGQQRLMHRVIVSDFRVAASFVSQSSLCEKKHKDVIDAIEYINKELIHAPWNQTGFFESLMEAKKAKHGEYLTLLPVARENFSPQKIIQFREQIVNRVDDEINQKRKISGQEAKEILRQDGRTEEQISKMQKQFRTNEAIRVLNDRAKGKYKKPKIKESVKRRYTKKIFLQIFEEEARKIQSGLPFYRRITKDDYFRNEFSFQYLMTSIRSSSSSMKDEDEDEEEEGVEDLLDKDLFDDQKMLLKNKRRRRRRRKNRNESSSSSDDDENNMKDEEEDVDVDDIEMMLSRDLGDEILGNNNNSINNRSPSKGGGGNSGDSLGSGSMLSDDDDLSLLLRNEDTKSQRSSSFYNNNNNSSSSNNNNNQSPNQLLNQISDSSSGGKNSPSVTSSLFYRQKKSNNNNMRDDSSLGDDSLPDLDDNNNRKSKVHFQFNRASRILHRLDDSRRHATKKKGKQRTMARIIFNKPYLVESSSNTRMDQVPKKVMYIDNPEEVKMWASRKEPEDLSMLKGKKKSKKKSKKNSLVFAGGKNRVLLNDKEENRVNNRFKNIVKEIKSNSYEGPEEWMYKKNAGLRILREEGLRIGRGWSRARRKKRRSSGGGRVGRPKGSGRGRGRGRPRGRGRGRRGGRGGGSRQQQSSSSSSAASRRRHQKMLDEIEELEDEGEEESSEEDLDFVPEGGGGSGPNKRPRDEISKLNRLLLGVIRHLKPLFTDFTPRVRTFFQPRVYEHYKSLIYPNKPLSLSQMEEACMKNYYQSGHVFLNDIDKIRNNCFNYWEDEVGGDILCAKADELYRTAKKRYEMAMDEMDEQTKMKKSKSSFDLFGESSNTKNFDMEENNEEEEDDDDLDFEKNVILESKRKRRKISESSSSSKTTTTTTTKKKKKKRRNKKKKKKKKKKKRNNNNNISSSSEDDSDNNNERMKDEEESDSEEEEEEEDDYQQKRRKKSKKTTTSRKTTSTKKKKKRKKKKNKKKSKKRPSLSIGGNRRRRRNHNNDIDFNNNNNSHSSPFMLTIPGLSTPRSPSSPTTENILPHHHQQEQPPQFPRGIFNLNQPPPPPIIEDHHHNLHHHQQQQQPPSTINYHLDPSHTIGIGGVGGFESTGFEDLLDMDLLPGGPMLEDNRSPQDGDGGDGGDDGGLNGGLDDPNIPFFFDQSPH